MKTEGLKSNHRNIKKIVLTALIIVSFAVMYLFVFFTRYNYLSAEWDKFHDTLVYVNYGEPKAEGKELVILSKQSGFSYINAGGCTLHGPKANGIDCYNKIMRPYLNHKLGPEWESKLFARADSLYYQDRIDAMRKAVLAIDEVNRLDKYLDSMSGGKTRVSVWILSEEEHERKLKDGYEENASMGWIRPDSSMIIVRHYSVDPGNLNVRSIMY